MKSLRSIPLLLWCFILLSYVVPLALWSLYPLVGMMKVILLLPTFSLLYMVCRNKTSEERHRFEKQRLEEELLRTKEQLQTLLDSLDIALFTLDTSTMQGCFSSGIVKITGYGNDHFTGKPFWEQLIHPDDRLNFRQDMEAMYAGETSASEYRILDRQGDVKWVLIRAFPTLTFSGALARVDGLILDITDKKRLEESILRSEEHYKSLFHHNTDVICKVDLSGRIVSLNPAAQRIMGELSLLGTEPDIESFVLPQYVRATQEAFQLTLQGQSQRYELESYRRDGTAYVWDVTNVPIIVQNQITGIYIICKEITRQKEMQLALAKSEERYRRLVELSPLPISIYKDNGLSYVNPAGVRVLGAERMEELIGIPVLDHVIPEHREMVYQRMGLAVSEHYSPPYVFKVKRLDGSVVDLEVTGIYDEPSASIQLVFVDITERLRSEQLLKESEKRYRRLVEIMPHGIAEHREGRFSYVNPAAVRLLGADGPEQLLGREVADIVLPSEHEKLQDRIERTVTDGYTPLLTYKVVRLDGKLVDVEGAAIYDKAMDNILVVFHDITDRMKSERALLESEERYFFLQTSLDQFSRDLAGVMKIHDLERRLVNEIRSVLQISSVSLIEAEADEPFRLCCGEIASSAELYKELRTRSKELPQAGEVLELESGYAMKVAEVSGKTYILCFEDEVHALRITSKKVWLQTIIRYVNVLYDNFRVIEDLTMELRRNITKQEVPAWLLRLIFSLSENERKRLSQDLHDAALQEQIIWLRRLEGVLCAESTPVTLKPELEKIKEGLLDVVYQIRLTCNELRPPFLKEWGLVTALESLFDYTQLHSDYSIEFGAEQFRHMLTDDQMISLYRIVQELLSNASKHSCASLIQIGLTSDDQRMCLTYRDNGIGMELSQILDSFESMGMYGIRERVRSLEGEIEIESIPSEGLSVTITLPLLTKTNVFSLA